MVDFRINWTLCNGAVRNRTYRAWGESVYLFLGSTIVFKFTIYVKTYNGKS